MTTIRSSSDQSRAESKINEFNLQSEDVWIGLANISGSFAWADGSSVTYTNWDIGEGNGINTCVEIDGSNLSNGRWADVDCNTVNPAFLFDFDSSSYAPGATVDLGLGFGLLVKGDLSLAAVIAPVPLPASFLLLLSGLVGLGAVTRRTRPS